MLGVKSGIKCTEFVIDTLWIVNVMLLLWLMSLILLMNVVL